MKAQNKNTVNAATNAKATDKVTPVTKTEVKPVAKTEVKPAVKTVAKTEVKPVTKAEVKPEVKPVAKAVAQPEVKPVSAEPKEVVVCNINGINVSNNCRIELAANPKRAGSKAHERYAAYAESHTVGEYLDNGGLKADLRYDAGKGFLTLLDVVVDGKLVIKEVK